MKVIELYARAANLGNNEAHYHSGDMYCKGGDLKKANGYGRSQRGKVYIGRNGPDKLRNGKSLLNIGRLQHLLGLFVLCMSCSYALKKVPLVVNQWTQHWMSTIVPAPT